MNKIDKLDCSHDSLAAFDAYTRDYQQLQMKLCDFDVRSSGSEQHVRQYIKGLLESAKQVIDKARCLPVSVNMAAS